MSSPLYIKEDALCMYCNHFTMKRSLNLSYLTVHLKALLVALVCIVEVALGSFA